MIGLLFSLVMPFEQEDALMQGNVVVPLLNGILALN
jgi:hypothetical protein